MKGQLQITEPILIVVILGILAVVGIIFFIRADDAVHEADLERARDLQAVETLKVTTTMPELACPKSITSDTFCIDLGKAKAFAKLSMEDERRIFYQPLFGDARIELLIVNLNGGEETIILYDVLVENADVTATSTHFTVYDPLSNERRMALMTVLRES